VTFVPTGVHQRLLVIAPGILSVHGTNIVTVAPTSANQRFKPIGIAETVMIVTAAGMSIATNAPTSAHVVAAGHAADKSQPESLNENYFCKLNEVSGILQPHPNNV
jgi:hypothetical protein